MKNRPKCTNDKLIKNYFLQNRSQMKQTSKKKNQKNPDVN